MQTGILMVAFGTAHAPAQAAYDRLTECARTRFGALPLRWAFTSGFVRRKLAARGQPVAAPLEVLAALRQSGIERVVVQSLHVIAGEEYERLKADVRSLAATDPAFRLAMGLPLLASANDLARTVAALLAATPAARQPDEALIFMGHGNGKHPGELAYIAAASAFQEREARAFLGTVEGALSLETILAKLSVIRPPVKKAWLIPFMTVAGAHVVNDMAGPGPDSWAARLAQAGIESVPVMKGMAEIPGIADVWMDHAAAALAELDR